MKEEIRVDKELFEKILAENEHLKNQLDIINKILEFYAKHS